ncbi:MAG: hypothetical protein H7Z41_14580 [Cytophagales bacterium]|nr:hypothetical protein [Armatimonadota bacterium]
MMSPISPFPDRDRLTLRQAMGSPRAERRMLHGRRGVGKSALRCSRALPGGLPASLKPFEPLDPFEPLPRNALATTRRPHPSLSEEPAAGRDLRAAAPGTAARESSDA